MKNSFCTSLVCGKKLVISFRSREIDISFILQSYVPQLKIQLIYYLAENSSSLLISGFVASTNENLLFYSSSVSADTGSLTTLCWQNSFTGVEPGSTSTAMVPELILFRWGNALSKCYNGMLRQTLPLHTRLSAGNSSGRVTASHWFNTILYGKLSAGRRRKPKILISLEEMTVRNSYRLGLCMADILLCAQIIHHGLKKYI